MPADQPPAPARRIRLQMPATVLRHLAVIAGDRAAANADPDLLRALALADVSRHATGWTAVVPLGVDQAHRLLRWITPAAPPAVRGYAIAARVAIAAAAAALERAASQQPSGVGSLRLSDPRPTRRPDHRRGEDHR